MSRNIVNLNRTQIVISENSVALVKSVPVPYLNTSFSGFSNTTASVQPEEKQELRFPRIVLCVFLLRIAGSIPFSEPIPKY